MATKPKKNIPYTRQEMEQQVIALRNDLKMEQHMRWAASKSASDLRSYLREYRTMSFLQRLLFLFGQHP